VNKPLDSGPACLSCYSLGRLDVNIASVSASGWPSRSHGRLRAVRKRAQAAGASPAAQALRSDVLRRAASRGGTLRCAEAPRVACRDVDKSYASHRRPQHGAVARRLQDSSAAI